MTTRSLGQISLQVPLLLFLSLVKEKKETIFKDVLSESFLQSAPIVYSLK